MIPEDCCFDKFRLDAAGAFAQTMILVDDEARQESGAAESAPRGGLARPTRASRSAIPAGNAKPNETGSQDSGVHALNAKALVETAMELGIICSVLRPMKDDAFQGKVVRAAEAADIVCLDWEIFEDGGDSASDMIRKIIEKDNEQAGRLRLIAIYTGDTTNNKILEKIFNSIPENLKIGHEYKRTSREIRSVSGVRIIVLFKDHGVRLSDSRSEIQVSETDLPKRLQAEFSKLSEGLLSNVALTTIGALRRSTHHVLAKFSGRLDGPYFHHRAMIKTPEDAEGYAVDIVLSELKGAIEGRRIAEHHAGENAIKSRLREMADNDGCLVLLTDAKHSIECDAVSTLVVNGLEMGLGNGNLPNGLGKKPLQKEFSTFFSAGGKQETARDAMHEFAALTGVRAHPGSPPYRSGKLTPMLGLGTIVQDEAKVFLLCLQASCDCVRITGAEKFLFVPMDLVEESDPVHVVPAPNGADNPYVGLKVAKKLYRAARLIEFASCEATQTVNADAGADGSFYFGSTNEERFLWIADLKRRRALRVAQSLGQAMGRLGFDEFEPYRE